MRVIAGSARSLPLKTPEGLETRPTTDRIKETLFNILQNQISDCIFVDVYSGSGGIGIEAISRGAKKAYFIDNSPKAIKCIQENLQFTKFQDYAVVLKQDAFTGLKSINEKEVDIIFIDPPYDLAQERELLKVLIEINYATENTIIIIEANLATDFSFVNEYGFEIIKTKEYKTNKHVFISKLSIEN